MASEDTNNTVTPEKDEEARNKACDPTRSYIVQAPAGSGKTSLLTLRFLNLLTTVDYPEQIIAITFTRKAAAEMRERIIGELAAAEKQTLIDEDNAYKNSLRKAANDVLGKNKEENWQLLDQPNRLRISTIDSLCLQLSKQLPITSEFGAALSPTDDAAELYSEAARRTISELESLPEEEPLNVAYRIIAEHCNNATAQIEEALAKLLETREKWLPYLESGIDNIVKESTKAAQEKTIALMEKVQESIGYDNLQEIAEIGKQPNKKGSEEAFYKNLQALGNKKICCKIEHLYAWGDLINSILTKNGGRPSLRGQFPNNSTIDKDSKDKFKEILKRPEYNPNTDELQQLADLSNALPCDYADKVITAILKLLRPALEKLREVFSEKKSCDHSEFSINIRKALRDLGTGLGEKLDYKIKHILIDEYQDTSEAQYELANLLTQGWTPEDGRTIFMVGDPMQSIYRFRNAEVGVYLHTKNNGLKESRIKPHYLQLSKNFRSVRNTVDLFNAWFPIKFPDKENEHTGAIPYAHAVATKDGVAAITFDQEKDQEKYPNINSNCKFFESPQKAHETAVLIPADDDKDEANIIIDIINKELDDNKDNEEFRLAVLVRTRSAITGLIPSFEKNGINFQAVEIHKLTAKTIISDLMSLTKAIINPGDKIALLSLLRSPWCGLTLKELKAITSVNPLDMPDFNNLEVIGEEVRPRVELLKHVLQSSYSARANMSLRSLTEAAWIKLGGPAACQETDLKQAELYFSTLAKLENEKTLISPEDIDKAIKDLYALPDIREEAKKVQIMTIHKAKGLEFDTIILPGVDKKKGSTTYPLINFMDTENGLLIGLTQKTPKGQSLAQYFIKERDKEKEANELMRLLYVALTRAKKHIYITGKKVNEDKGPEPTSLLALLPRGDFHDKKGEKEVQAPVRELPKLEYIAGWDLSDNPAPAPPEALILEQIEPSDWQEKWTEKITDQKTDTAISVGEVPYLGTVVHNFFRIIAEEGLDNWNGKRLDDCKTAIKNSLISLGTNPAIANEHADHVLKVLKASLESKRARWILGAHEQAACEMRITGPLGDNEDLIDETKDNDKNRIIDRTFVENGIRWIIDYKTGQRSEKETDKRFAERKLDGRIGNHQTYREQLDSYATLLKKAGEKLTIKLALYFPFTNSDKTSDDPKEMFIEWEPEKTEFSINPKLP